MTVCVMAAMWLTSTAVVAGLLLSCSAWNLLRLFKPDVDTMDVKNVQLINCGSNNDPIQLKEIEVSHNNSRLGVSLRIQAKTNITEPIKATYTILRKGSLYSIPIRGVIQDICVFDALVTQQCTAKVNKLIAPCKCPIEKDQFYLWNQEFLILIPKKKLRKLHDLNRT
ncbi:uncharacterized protein LOC110833365 isoform X2 [Zootermopsis nevadensis]|uniref:uncharacterized protein LOC110833365 isoform X2 n=1 Tax=Zootermopsis nevadensis TaxID=136037 RepID=UPI000B8E9C24|nr:uncharacterized protein LOC110833365 isoform X2 [Zootermopsis nevadensis]